MKLDVALMTNGLREAAALAQAADHRLRHALTTETQHDPFLPLGVAALNTERIGLGTAIAVAFARNPASIAYLAWDLQAASNGRFILGLGTQVQAHIERRFGMPSVPPPARLPRVHPRHPRRLGVVADRGRLNFHGQHYKLTLMAPFFSPGPSDHPQIPVYIAAINARMCQLAGELCQGLHVHPFPHHPLLPRADHAQRAGWPGEVRPVQRSDLALSSSVFVITGETAEEMAQIREEIRSQVSFYA